MPRFLLLLIFLLSATSVQTSELDNFKTKVRELCVQMAQTAFAAAEMGRTNMTARQVVLANGADPESYGGLTLWAARQGLNSPKKPAQVLEDTYDGCLVLQEDNIARFEAELNRKAEAYAKAQAERDARWKAMQAEQAEQAAKQKAVEAEFAAQREARTQKIAAEEAEKAARKAAREAAAPARECERARQRPEHLKKAGLGTSAQYFEALEEIKRCEEKGL